MPHKANVYGLILAGGSGTRLWPLSRKELPKQFLTLEGDKSLLQNTLERLKNVIPVENIRVIAGEEWGALVRYQADAVGCSKNLLITEPCARNTAPAIALGIASLFDGGALGDDIAVVCPSDHIIKDMEALKAAIDIAVSEAKTGNIVTFGIVPATPETGFGYIKTQKDNISLTKKVLSFVEKPDREKAEQYRKDGCYYWNGGIFCFRLKDMAEAVCQYFPECGVLMKAGIKELRDGFHTIPSKSIDYAVMEKAQNISCVPLNAGWSDVGSWEAVWENLPKDKSCNVVYGDVVTENSKNNLIFSRNKLTAMIDVENIVAIDTADALFIAKRGSAQKVRNIVEALKSSARKEEYQAPESVRPWGTYKILSESNTDKIKRITVMPHKRLSLQYHNHRSEHWIVVNGMATVTLIDANDERKKNILTLSSGESCFVPARTLHRLANETDLPLEIIEVQTGKYLGEDDIVRVDDDFRRSGNENSSD